MVSPSLFSIYASLCSFLLPSAIRLVKNDLSIGLYIDLCILAYYALAYIYFKNLLYLSVSMKPLYLGLFKSKSISLFQSLFLFGNSLHYIVLRVRLAGISGNISMDENGDRNADYSLLDMDPATGQFQVRLIVYYIIPIYHNSMLHII